MTQQTINRTCASVPIIMSVLALCLLMAVLLFQGGTPQPDGDEGTVAHLFQLLIGGQAPFIAVYLITADWSRWQRVAGRIAVQVGAIGVALGPVAYFHL